MTKHLWQKGEKSPNPNGRPKKGRAIADQIEKALNKTEVGADGKKHKRITLLGEIFVKALTTGKVELPNGQTLLLPPREWMEMSKFIVGHVDGPLKTQLELSTDPDAPLTIKVVYGTDGQSPGLASKTD